jgi:hypothetical protein
VLYVFAHVRLVRLTPGGSAAAGELPVIFDCANEVQTALFPARSLQPRVSRRAFNPKKPQDFYSLLD